MRLVVSLFSVAALASAGAVSAQPVAAPDTARTVELELREGDQLIASPTVRVQIGRPAAISVGGYSMRFRMDRAAATGAGPAPYVIRSSLYRSDTGWTLVASPAVTVNEGEPVRHHFVGRDGSDLSLAVLVR